jgi:hypothetical protein
MTLGKLLNVWTPETYCDVFDQLERDHVRYAVVSGVAVVLHGYIRPVADLDLVISHTPDEMRGAIRALNVLGFVPSIPLPLSVLTVLRMFDQSQREVDVFVRYHIPFDELWASSECVCIGNSVVHVASLEHLLRAKRSNGRAHDLLDIEGLLALEVGGCGRNDAAPAMTGEQEE